MIRSSRLLVLAALSLALGAATCRKGARNAGETPPSEPSDSGPETGEPPVPKAEPARVGLYTCTLAIGEEDEVRGQCSVSSSQALAWSTGNLALRANLTPTTFGFEMRGSLTQGESKHELAADLYRQGAGSHAMVSHLGDGTVLRFALLPPSAR